MAPYEKKVAVHARSGASLLKIKLEGIGIPVPDQGLVGEMMEAGRLGFHPLFTSRRRVRWAFLRRALASPFTVFTYEEFIASHARDWGGEPPWEVRKTVGTIRRSIPGAEIRIFATYDDPWLAVGEFGEHLVVHGWYRAPNSRAVQLII